MSFPSCFFSVCFAWDAVHGRHIFCVFLINGVHQFSHQLPTCCARTPNMLCTNSQHGSSHLPPVPSAYFNRECRVMFFVPSTMILMMTIVAICVHSKDTYRIPRDPTKSPTGESVFFFFFFGGGGAVVSCPKLGDVTVLRPKVLEDEQNLQDDRHQVASKMERYRPIDYI